MREISQKMRWYSLLFIHCNLFQQIDKMNRIKEVLQKKGITQTWLSEELGKSYNMVNSYAQNRKQPRLEVLFEIAKILDVEVKDLIENINKK